MSFFFVCLAKTCTTPAVVNPWNTCDPIGGGKSLENGWKYVAVPSLIGAGVKHQTADGARDEMCGQIKPVFVFGTRDHKQTKHRTTHSTLKLFCGRQSNGSLSGSEAVVFKTILHPRRGVQSEKRQNTSINTFSQDTHMQTSVGQNFNKVFI